MALGTDAAPRFGLSVAGTQISYDLPAKTDVLVRITDRQGKLVRVLSAGILEPGEHRLTWDGLDTVGQKASDDTYQVHIEAGLQARIDPTFADGGVLAGTLKHNNPWDLEVDSQGNLFVLDAGEGKELGYVFKFSSTGVPLADFYASRHYVTLGSAFAFTVAPNDDIFIGGSGVYQIHKTNRRGEVLQLLGGYERGHPGVVRLSRGLATGPGTHVCCDTKVFEHGGTRDGLDAFLYTFESGPVPGYPPGLGLYLSPRLASDQHGRLYFTNFRNQLVCCRDTGYALEILYSAGKTGSGPGEFLLPLGPACDGKGTVWIADRNNSRIQRLADTGGDLPFMWAFGQPGSDPAKGEFGAPHAVAVSPDGQRLYVAEDNRAYPFAKGKDDTVQGQGRVSCYRLSYQYTQSQPITFP